MNEAIIKKLNNLNTFATSEGWQAKIIQDVSSPILIKGLELLQKNGDLLLAICLNNGYYSKENIYRMLRFSLAFSERVQIFFTDGPAKHNYRAKGESENEIIRECRLHRNRLRNHCIHGLERINAGRADKEKYNVTFLDWSNIYQDKAYQASYDYLKRLYIENGQFHKDVDDTTHKVLLNRIGETTDLEAKISIAIEYVLEELAFILSYPKLNGTTKPSADHGVNGFNYMYYEPWPVFENLANGVYDDKLRSEIGFSIVKI